MLWRFIKVWRVFVSARRRGDDLRSYTTHHLGNCGTFTARMVADGPMPSGSSKLLRTVLFSSFFGCDMRVKRASVNSHAFVRHVYM